MHLLIRLADMPDRSSLNFCCHLSYFRHDSVGREVGRRCRDAQFLQEGCREYREWYLSEQTLADWDVNAWILLVVRRAQDAVLLSCLKHLGCGRLCMYTMARWAVCHRSFLDFFFLSLVTAFSSLTSNSKHTELKLVYLIKRGISSKMWHSVFLPARVTSRGNWMVR